MIDIKTNAEYLFHITAEYRLIPRDHPPVTEGERLDVARIATAANRLQSALWNVQRLQREAAELAKHLDNAFVELASAREGLSDLTEPHLPAAHTLATVTDTVPLGQPRAMTLTVGKD